VENFIFLIVIVILQGFIFASFTKRVACEKGYSDTWYAAGFCFGLIALIAACGLPDRRRDTGVESDSPKRKRRLSRDEVLAKREKERRKGVQME